MLFAILNLLVTNQIQTKGTLLRLVVFSIKKLGSCTSAQLNTQLNACSPQIAKTIIRVKNKKGLGTVEHALIIIHNLYILTLYIYQSILLDGLRPEFTKIQFIP